MDSIAVVPLDIHKKFSVAAPMTREGKVTGKFKVTHKGKGPLREFFQRFEKGTDVVMEATFNWPWIADLSEECGLRPHLAHPPRLRELAKGMAKSDRKDAIFHGRLWLAGGDVFPESYLAPPEVREKRQLFRTRLLLVRMRTKVKNNIHGQLFRIGILFEGEDAVSDLFSVKGRQKLSALRLSERERYVLDKKLGVIDNLNERIQEIEREIRKELERDGRGEILDSIPGIGEILAYTILGEIGDIKRFVNGRALAAYAGLLPLSNESAEKDFGKKTSKRSNQFLRVAAIEAVTGAIQTSERMKSLHARVKAKNKKKAGKARVAVAREIIELVHLLLTKNEKYREERAIRPGSKINGKEEVIKGFTTRTAVDPDRASPVFLYADARKGSQADG